MLNIEKHLDDIKVEHKKPSQKLIDDTIFEIHKLNGKKGINWDWLFNIKTLAAFSLSVATLLIMLVINFNATPNDIVAPVHAFYSVDINPSVIISVNDKEEVVAVEALNDDANVILEQAELIGLHSRQAITIIVDLAKDNGFITDENKYVLIGRFGSDNGAIVPEMQEYFEENFDENVQVLIVTGSMSDKDEADDKDVSPGLLELSNAVNSEEPSGEDGIENVLEGSNEDGIDLPAVEIDLTIEENIFTFNFNQLTFDEEEYEGVVVYKLVRAKTVEEILDYKYETLIRKAYYSKDVLPVSMVREALLRDYHYAVIVEYEGGVRKFSNTIYVEEEKFVDDTPKFIEGVKLEEDLKLVWTKAQGDAFSGYRIVASKDNAEPKYPDVDSIILISDINTTQLIITPGQYGLEEGVEYNFSVTYMYEEDTRYANAISLVTGETEEEPEPTPTPTPTPVVRTKADLISAELDGNKLYLNWEKIEKSNFKGYKVVYSYTDSTPVYGEDGSYYYQYITDRTTTSTKIDLSSIAYRNTSKNEKIYVSITALYEGEPTKVAGNVKVATIPEALLVTEEPVASNIINHDLRENYDVFLEWEKIDLLSLEGYKVVYSFTDSTPVYGESGTNYKYWITNNEVVEKTINLQDIISKNTTGSNVVYFSITSLYNNHSVKKAGNVVMVEIPEALRDEEPEEPIAANIFEHEFREERYIDIAWNQIDLNSLQGYKVVYSFTDSTPVYGQDGSHYAYWITDNTVTEKTIDLLEIIGENSVGSDKVYVSVTAVYSDYSVKKAGNVVTINVPESMLPEPLVATNILTVTEQDDEKVKITWEENPHDDFLKYRIIYSYTSETPELGASGTYELDYYTERGITHRYLLFSELESNPTESPNLYVRIVTQFDGTEEKKSGNVKTIVLPTPE